MQAQGTLFQSEHERYYADTCEPLQRAVAREEVRLVAQVHGAYPGNQFPPDIVSEVCTVGYWDATHNQVWGLDWHRNEGIELTYVARGRVDFAVDGQHFNLKPGDLTITRPWQRHRVGDPHVTACRLYWLILDTQVRRPNHEWRWPTWLVSSANDMAYLTTALSQNEQPVWQGGEEIGWYFERLGEIAASFDPVSGESYIRLYIGGLIVALTNLLRRQQPTLDKSLPSAQRTVELFLASLPDHVEQQWDLSTMAAACGLRRSQFTYHCKQLMNMTPSEYLSRCRIAASRSLLTRTHIPITDVAMQCGFSTSQYFATVFHRQVGCSPRAYRSKTLVHL